MPRVSVLLPVHNAAATLTETLASLSAQTFSDFEVVAVDDGSTDGSGDLLEVYARKDSRFCMVRQPHAGIEAALIEAAGIANGEYLARIDADDLAHPERLADQVRLLDAQPKLGAVGSHFEWFGEPVASGRLRYREWLNGLTHPEELWRDLFVECPIAHPALTMRRTAYEAAGGYRRDSVPEDYDLILRLAQRGYALANVPRPLLQWRHSAARLSVRSPRYTLEAFRAVKRRYLFEFHPLADRAFVQWGAGAVGKAWLREWDGVCPAAVVDLHPRKVGKAIHGVPVIAPEDLPAPGDALIAIAVGAPGARGEIRAWLAERGYVESRDFVALA